MARAARDMTAHITTGFGHGKLILAGEHAVVFGETAIAAGVPVGVRALASPGDGRVSVAAWGVEARAGDGSAIGRAAQALLSRMGARDLDFRLEAAIPPRAGLGSSAAMAVAMARAAADRTGVDEAEVMAAVAESEAVFHGTPSGIDAAAAFHGGVGVFRRGQGWRPVAVLQPIEICVGLTGKPRDTAAQVEAVGRLCARIPAARRIVETLGEVAGAVARALEIGDIDTLGRLLDVAHGLLGGLRVSSPELDAMVHAARSAGAIGAKLTGAGGGGAVIAIAPAHEGDVLAKWRAMGCHGFHTAIGKATVAGRR